MLLLLRHITLVDAFVLARALMHDAEQLLFSFCSWDRMLGIWQVSQSPNHCPMTCSLSQQDDAHCRYSLRAVAGAPPMCLGPVVRSESSIPVAGCGVALEVRLPWHVEDPRRRRLLRL